MRIKFYIYDSNNISAGKQIEIQFKSYQHDVYQVQQVEKVTEYDPRIYEATFTFQNQNFIYYSFRNSKTYQSGEQKTISISSYPKNFEEIIIFTEMRLDIPHYGGYTQINGTLYSGYYNNNRESNNYLVNFIQLNTDVALYKNLIAYISTLSFSYHMDKANLLKNICIQVIQKTLPHKINQEIPKVQEIFDFLDIIDEDIKKQEAYNICSTLSKIIKKCNIYNFVNKATILMKAFEKEFKLTDWLKELNSTPVTQYSIIQIEEILCEKIKEQRLDSESNLIMDELVKIKQNGNSLDTIKGEIVKRCYDDQMTDILKLRFLFKYTDYLIRYTSQYKVKEEFIQLLNQKRQKFIHKDILKEIAQNSKVFIKYYDSYGEIFFKYITKNIFQKDLYENEQIQVFEALQENNLTIIYPWKKILLESIRAHKQLDDIQRIVQIIIRVNPHTFILEIIKKYYGDRIHHFYVSIFEKMQMKTTLVALIKQQYEIQQYSKQLNEQYDEEDDDDEIFSDFGMDFGSYNYLDDWSNEYGSDCNFYQYENKDRSYKNREYNNRGNMIVYNETRLKENKDSIFKEKSLTYDEIISFETYTIEQLHDVFKKFKSTELVKDAKSYSQKNEIVINELLILLQNHFGQYMMDEWNHYVNFKEKYEGLNKLAEEKTFRRDIALIVMKKYNQSAIEYYNSQKNKSPHHFYNKNLVEFMTEAFWLDETAEFRDIFLFDFSRFIEGYQETSISTLKQFLTNKETPKVFSIVKQDFNAFKENCNQVIEIFDKMMDQIGQLFKNYKDLFKKQQEIFLKEFNIEQKSGNIIGMIQKFEDINQFTDFNYSLKDSDIYQNIKRFILLSGKFENEFELFAALKDNLEFFVKFIVQDKEIEFKRLQKYNFEEIASEIKYMKLLQQMQENELKQQKKQAQMEEEAFINQNIQHQQNQNDPLQLNQNIQQNQQGVQVNQQQVLVEQNILLQQQQQQQLQQHENQQINQVQNQNNNFVVQQQQQQPNIQVNQENQMNEEQQQHPQVQQNQQHDQEEDHEEEGKHQEQQEKGNVQKSKILITLNRCEKLSIVDLKNLTGSTYEKCIENIFNLLKILDIDFNKGQLESKIFNIYTLDFFKKYMNEILDLFKQYGIDINNPTHDRMKQQLELFWNIQNFNSISIWELANYQFTDLFDCFQPVTLFDPRLVDLLRRSQDIVQFSYDNFTGEEGRGFLDLNDIIDDQDADISSLIIKLNQLTPFINQLVQIKKNSIENSEKQDAKKILIQLFDAIYKYLQKDDDQINLEDSINNFFKIKNMSLTFDKKKSYILLSQQIVNEGKMKIYFDKSQQSVCVQVILEDKVYQEDEINQICSKVIIEQNTTTIIINQARRAIAQKNKQQHKQSVQNQMEEETIPDQKDQIENSRVMHNEEGDEQESHDSEQENLLMESAAIKQKIEQFKEMWIKIGDLKVLMNEINLLGYFDIHEMQLEYLNQDNQIEINFDKINNDKRNLQNLLKSWKEQIRECCSQYPLFSFIGHNLYSDMYMLLIGQKKFKDISLNLQDILQLEILSQQFLDLQNQLSFQEKNKNSSKQMENENVITSHEKLLKISSWFKGNYKKNQQLVEQQQEGEQKVEAIIYSGNKELVDVVFKILDKQNMEQQPLQFYQYFYCDSLTQIQDFDLFINRFLYFIQDIPKIYILILNNKLEAAFTLRAIETIQKVNKKQQSIHNKIVILGRREFYSELISNINQISVEDFLLKFKEKSEKREQMMISEEAEEDNKYKTTFFTSNHPGAGKSFQIQKIFNKYKEKNNVRIAINGSGSKKDLIELFRERLSYCDKDSSINIHLDIYPYDQYDLNMLLFELIAFRSLSIHQKSFIQIGQQVSFYIEINNTLKNDLQESLFIKEHFKNVNLKFNIEDYNPIVDIIGYKNYSYAAIVCNYLQNMLFNETEKNVFDRYQPLENEQDQQENNEEQQGGDNRVRQQQNEEDNQDEEDDQEEQEEQEQNQQEENDEDDNDEDDEDDEDEELESQQNRQNQNQIIVNQESQLETEIQNLKENVQMQQEMIINQFTNISDNTNNLQREEVKQDIEERSEVFNLQQNQQNTDQNHNTQQYQEQRDQQQSIQQNNQQSNYIQSDAQRTLVENILEAETINNNSLQKSQSSQQSQHQQQNIQIPQQLNIEEQIQQPNGQQQEQHQIRETDQEQESHQNQNQARNSPMREEQELQYQINQIRQNGQQQQQEQDMVNERDIQNDQDDNHQNQNVNNNNNINNNNNMQLNEGDAQDESFFDYTIFEKVEYKVDNLDFLQELLKRYFVDKLTAQNIEPCFHQLTNFINLFGSEMQKFEKCFFLEKHILYELEPQLLQSGLRTKVVELSLQLCFLVSTNQQRAINIPIDPQNKNRREYILNEKAQRIQRFSELMSSFVTFQEQENPCLTSFFPSSGQVPRCISNLYSIQGHLSDLIYFDQNIPQQKLLKWLNMLINKNGDTISEEVENKVKRLAIQRDNFFKIAMIFMRIRALSPIVLMGEAGTGKTALIELLSALMDAKFYTMNIHAGVTENEVINFIYASINSIQRENQKAIVFFDEMNTNRLVEGIFKEIIVDRCLKGQKLPDNFIPITAINPYKLKSKEQKQTFNLQVHGGIKREVMSRMNNTDLEYMVEPLPESLYSFIWNIDHLSNDEEDQYIVKIVQYKNQEREHKNKPFFSNDQFRRIINSLSQSQKYLRRIMGCQSACSLRDIARFTKLLFWFQGFLSKCIGLGLILHSLQECAITLALYVNYCVRIPLQQHRKDYLDFIFSGEHAQEDVEKVQTFLSNQIEVPKGIVKNTAFKQNTLTLFASIMNKIPVILIGQPGCTKTLSLRLLIQSLRGDQSKSELFKSLKTLVPIYYQGHVQSTSERIMDVFINANKKQQKIESDNQQKRYLSLVYLEEIGLAEISPHNPLKVLHQALEKPQVAVACISNWPLDQSKMNRMLSVYRLDTSKDELIETVQCIYDELVSYEKDEFLREALQSIKLSLQFAKWSVKIYYEYNKFLKKKLPEHEQFHGLRDFYGMAKLFCSKFLDYVLDLIFKHVDKNNTIVLQSIQIDELIEIDQNEVKQLIIDSFLRHFSGLREAYKYLQESINFSLYKEAKEKQMIPEPNNNEQEQPQINNQQSQGNAVEQQLEEEIPDTKIVVDKKQSSKMEVEKENNENMNLEINELKMIDENLCEKSKYFLSRNLMIISQNTQKALEYISNKITSMNQPVKIFLGSDFPDDKKSETSYQIINEIISCIESGVFVVLQNLDNVYQSLYELLNQNYHYYNGKYFCRVSLGSDTSNVEVSTNFKIILIANHVQIPHLSGPLLNRFEKHIFEQYMILNDDDQNQIQQIENHFIDKKQSSSHIFSCNNVNQVIESAYLQYKIQNDRNSQIDQTVILRKLYHMAPFKRVLFYSKDQSFLDDYINSSLHFSINDFLENRIIRDQNLEVKSFSIFSTSAFSSTSIKLQYGEKNLSQSVIHLAEVTSQMNLSEKLKDFFEGTKELNNDAIIEGIDILNVEEGKQDMKRRRTASMNLSSQTIQILFVVCDMEDDSIERINFTKQKISEFMQNSNQQSKDKIVIMIIKVTENFMMMPVSNNWEYYFIDELIPLQNVNCIEMKSQMNLQSLLANKNIPFLKYFRIEPLLQSFLKSSENISISYRKVRYQQDLMNYKTNRLSQLKSILLNLHNCDKWNKFNYLLTQIVQIKVSYLLHSLEIKTIEDFIHKQVFSKGFIYQASSILKAIISGLEDLMQQSLCFFIEILEKQQLIYSLSQKQIDNEIFQILMNRILKSLDLVSDNQYKIEQFEKLTSQIDIYQNSKFSTRGVQLISVSIDLLFPIEQSKIISPLIQIIQKQIQIYTQEKQNLLQTVEHVINQVQDLFPAYDISIMQKYENFFTRDYFLTRSPEFNQSHSRILYEIIGYSYNLSQLENLNKLLTPILGFEKYHRQIIKTQVFIELFEAEIQFKFREDKFKHFINNNLSKEEMNKKDEIILFNFFIVGEIFQYLYENLAIISKKNQIQQYFTKLLRFIDSLDIIQYKFVILDRIIQISKMIIQFSSEIFDTTQRNYDIFKNINFEEIRDLNFAYIQELKEQICSKLILDQEENDPNLIFQQYNVQMLLESDKPGEKKEQVLKNLETQIFQKQEKKLIQFEKSWCKFITSVILSNVNEIFLENEPINSKLLKFIVDLEISMTTQKSENIQQIFNVLVNETFGHVKIEQLITLYGSESENPCLPNEQQYHTEHFSLVILSQLIQENIIRPTMSNNQGSQWIDIILFEQFEELSILQKVIYFSIFREIMYQIFKDNFTNLINIYTIEESNRIKNQISNFIKKLKSKPFQLYILKQLYQLCKSDMSTMIQESSFFSVEWITDFTRSFKRLSETDFLRPIEKETFRKYFDSYTTLQQSVKDLIYGEIRFSKNAFRDIYDGQLQIKYYPFMMYNNIQILFDRDPKNNNQLYQCQKCQEYIFSDQCPDLQSKHKCLQCGSVIALNNQNTKRVLQNACQNIAELHKIINEDQWKGYYLILQDDKTDFKLNEGTSFDLRLMSLIYNTVFLLSKTKNYRYSFQQKENLVDQNNNVQEITINELNKNLRIHYEANAEDHLNYQIEISLNHIKEYLTKIYKVKDDDIPIILFKFIYNLICESEVKDCDTVQERQQQNIKLAEIVKSIYEDLSRLSQVEQSFSKKILEQQDNLNLQTNYKRSLRYFDTEYKLESIYIQINEQIPNNEFQVLKKLLNFKEVNQISRILRVFVKFYKYMNREFSNKYSLTKAQDISFSKGLKNNEDNPLYQFYISEFLPAWNELREREKHFQIECEQIEIPQFDINTKINFLVYGEQKNLGSFTNALELVCQLQNNYIHHIYQLSAIDSNENKVDSKITQQVKNLFESSDDNKNLKQKPLDQINPSIHLLKSYSELILKNYVFSNLEYGNGKKYVFDLEQLQQRLVKDVLTGAVLIDLEKSIKFKYLNEVNQIGLLTNNLIPQEIIFFEIRSKIQKQFANKEQAFEFLQQLSTIFQMFKAESLQAELSIKSALDILQLKLKQENMKEILSEQLKLKHLNDLICCVEEIQMENLVELCNPFYKQPIQQESAQKASEFINKFDINIDDFLIALGRFTIRCLSSDASSISPQANLFEQIFYTDIYSELWRDPSKLDKLYKDAVEVKVLIGQSYELFQYIQKQKNNLEMKSREIVVQIKEENIPNIIL